MKKLTVMVLCLILLSACGSAAASASGDVSSQPPPSTPSSAPAGSSSGNTPTSPSSTPSGNPSSAVDGDLVIIEKPYGSYSLPATWYEEEAFSDDSVAFYLQEGTPLDTPTSNISVSEDTNRYAEDDFQSFARAIDQQLRAQAAAAGASYTDGGSTTDRGYPLITMVIEGSDGTVTTQYYIVGDYRFVMVHTTDFHDEAILDIDDAALAIVHSFVWADAASQ